MRIENLHVAVTGGAGFIGSHLVDRLLSRGNRVTVIDDFSSGSSAHVSHHGSLVGLQVIEADVRDEAAMLSAFRSVDAVFHLATRNVRLSLSQPTLVHDVNVNGTYTVLKAAAAAGVKRLLYCSSSEVNGTAKVVPMPEDYHYQPETIYGASKLTGEYYAAVFHKAGWLPTVIARPHNNYGPREHFAGHHGEVIPRFILWALAGHPLVIFGDGKQTRDFTYVTETADYLVRVLECDGALGGTFNVCRGQEVSINELAETIVRAVGSSSRIEHVPGRPSDVLRLFGDPSRLKLLLGNSPSMSIGEGLAGTIEWFREHVLLTDDLFRSLQPQNWHAAIPEDWLHETRRRRDQRSAA